MVSKIRLSKNNLIAHVVVGMSGVLFSIVRYKVGSDHCHRYYKHLVVAVTQIKTYIRHNLIASDKKRTETAKRVCQEFCVNHFSVCRIIVFHKFRHTLIHQQLVANERPVWYLAPRPFLVKLLHP